MPSDSAATSHVAEQHVMAPPLFGPIERPTEAQPGSKLEPLTAREKEMLLLERKWFQYAGVKENFIRERWDISTTRYFQLLNQIIDKESALAWDPVTVNRLRRLRAERQRSRSARRLDR
jgi:hypothetical protein